MIMPSLRYTHTIKLLEVSMSTDTLKSLTFVNNYASGKPFPYDNVKFYRQFNPFNYVDAQDYKLLMEIILGL